MGLAQPEDSIARQGTDELRQMIVFSETHNEQAMKTAELERNVAEVVSRLERLEPKPSDNPKHKLQIKTQCSEEFVTYFISVPIYIDTPGLACLQDFANAVRRHNTGGIDSMCLSISAWHEAASDRRKHKLKRRINFITGILAGDKLDGHVVRGILEQAWNQALFPSTTVAELCSNSADTTEVAGYVQKTLYGNVWSDLITAADESGYFHPDNNGNHSYQRAVWRPQGCPCYDGHPKAWFAEFAAAIAHDHFPLRSKKSRTKLQEMLQRMPNPR